MSARMLAVDPGTHCGYAWIDVPQNKPAALRPLPAQAGVWDLSVKRHEGGGMRYLRVKKHITELEPQLVLYEEVAAHKGTAAAHVYGGIVATVQAYCEECGVEYMGVPVGTIKKRASGKGNCGKAVMIARANEEFVRTGEEKVEDDNIADALWLLQIGLDEYGDVI